MVKVVANERGYFGGIVREIGAEFSVPDDLWQDKSKRPKWVSLDPRSVFGGKGDHDGNGSVGGSKPSAPAGPVEIPESWQEMTAAERKILAKAISGQAVANSKDAAAVIEAEVERRQPAASQEPPAPTPAGSGLQEALGGADPDWVLPNSQAPQPVAD